MRLRRLTTDDSGVAGVVGFILVFAVAVAIFARTVHTQIPANGKEAERGWDDDVAASLRQANEALAVALQNGAPGTALVPPAPHPRAIDIPMLGRAEPARASGTVSFAPDCASFTATHVLSDGTTVSDLAAGSTGCLAFQAAPAYSSPFGERLEFGGLLRTQSGRGVVVQGPPLQLDASAPNVQRVTLGLAGLRGPAMTLSADTTPVRIDLVPGPSATEVEQAPNAVSARWTLTTHDPGAWKTWFEGRFDASSLAGASVACQPTSCSVGSSGRGTVVVDLAGPLAPASGNDLKLSVVYGLFDTGLR